MDSAVLTEETKQKLQPLLHNFEFSESRDCLKWFQCRKCRLVALFHVTGQCKHRPLYCKCCFSKLEKRECEECFQVIAEEGEKNTNLDQQLAALKVACGFKKHGCSQKIPLSKILLHQETCRFRNFSVKKIRNDEDGKTKSDNSLNLNVTDGRQSKRHTPVDEDINEIKKAVKDLQRRVTEYENNIKSLRKSCKRMNEIESLNEKLTKEVNEKHEADKRLSESLKRYTTQQLNKYRTEMEKRQMDMINSKADSLKRDIIQIDMYEMNHLFEKQIPELKKKLEHQNKRNSDQLMDSVRRKVMDQIKAQVEGEIDRCEVKFAGKLSKKTELFRKALRLEISKDVQQEVEKRLAKMRLKSDQLNPSSESLASEGKNSNVEQADQNQGDQNYDVEEEHVETLDELHLQSRKHEVEQLISDKLQQNTEVHKNFILETITEQLDQRMVDMKENFDLEGGKTKQQLEEATTMQIDRKMATVKLELENIIQDQLSLKNFKDSDEIQSNLTSCTPEQLEDLDQVQKQIEEQMNVLKRETDTALQDITSLNVELNEQTKSLTSLQDVAQTTSQTMHQLFEKVNHLESATPVMRLEMSTVDSAVPNVSSSAVQNVSSSVFQNSSQMTVEDLKLWMSQELKDFRSKILTETTSKLNDQKEEIMKQILDRLDRSIANYETTMQDKILRKLNEEIQTRKEALIVNIMKQLHQRTANEIETLHENIIKQWNERSTIQKDEMVSQINNQICQELEKKVSRLERSMSMQFGTNEEPDSGAHDDYAQSPQLPVEQATFKSPHLTPIVSDIQRQMHEIQNQITVQITEKVKQQEEEILNRLKANLNEYCESLMMRYKDGTGHQDCNNIIAQVTEKAEAKITELTTVFTSQVQNQLEKHIGDAKTPIKALIESELEKIKKQYDDQRCEFLTSRAEMKKVGGKIRMTTQRSIKRLREFVVERETTCYNWKIASISEKLVQMLSNPTSTLQNVFESGIIHIKGTPLRAKMLLTSLDQEWLSIRIQFLPPKHGDINNITYSHKRSFMLLDQSCKSRDRKDRIVIRESDFKDESTKKWTRNASGIKRFIKVATLTQEDSRYVLDDEIVIKLLLQPTATLYKSILSNDGILLWKINNYSKNKEAEMNGLIESVYSDYFSTNDRGYRCQVRAYLNGIDDSKSKFMSVYLHFRKGQWDDFLSHDFKYKVTFALLHHNSLEEGITKSSVYTEDKILSGYGYEKFALQTEVETPYYLNDDSIILKVVVEAL